MTKFFRWLCAGCFLAALAAVIALVATDAANHLRFTVIHQRAGGLSLILIGCSYVALQFTARRRPAEAIKDILLGIAFILWGSEEFLPPSPWVTVMDTAVVTIFVVDLSLVIAGRLKRREDDAA
jgi:hypothetical protein